MCRGLLEEQKTSDFHLNGEAYEELSVFENLRLSIAVMK